MFMWNWQIYGQVQIISHTKPFDVFTKYLWQLNTRTDER